MIGNKDEAAEESKAHHLGAYQEALARGQQGQPQHETGRDQRPAAGRGHGDHAETHDDGQPLEQQQRGRPGPLHRQVLHETEQPAHLDPRLSRRGVGQHVYAGPAVLDDVSAGAVLPPEIRGPALAETGGERE